MVYMSFQISDCGTKNKKRLRTLFKAASCFWYRGRESNPYERFGSQDFKSCVSTSSTTPASNHCFCDGT